MTYFKRFFLLTIQLWCCCSYAQIKPIELNEVTVTDWYLSKNSTFQNTKKLNDSIIKSNVGVSLTSLLNNQSLIFFKENGLGMVSSPSFRGTTSQQTAVIWNGININSALNGQTDFNLLSIKSFNQIAVRAGGGSSRYGTGAIGGSIHLSNHLNYQEGYEVELFNQVGSFDTFSGGEKLNLNSWFNSIHCRVASNKKTLQIQYSRNSSDNDYKYLNTTLKNENGAFTNDHFSLQFGYQLNNKNQLAYYNQLLQSDRQFSAALYSVSNAKYKDLQIRNLLEWTNLYGQLVSKTKVAHLLENYQYFTHKNNVTYTGNTAKTFILKYEGLYPLGHNMVAQFTLEFNQTKAFGDNIKTQTRTFSSNMLALQHQVANYFKYELSTRKEVTQLYESPLLFAVGGYWSLSKKYKITHSISRNFRIPTFNDMFWQPSGNPNLKPESAYQFEIGNQFCYHNNSIKLNLYYNNITDMLRWIPNQLGVWQPFNTDKVITYGGELMAQSQNFKIGQHQFSGQYQYAYTISENQLNHKQLIYVPFHKSNTRLNYQYKKLKMNGQFVYTGNVYTSSDNKYKLPDYGIVNASVFYSIDKKSNYVLAFHVLNATNEDYQSYENRPLPGRNYSISINLKF